MKAFYFLIALMSFLSTSSQTWQVVGDTVASDWEVGAPFIIFNKTNDPHIAFFSNQSYPNTRPGLRKFNGQQWAQVGSNIDTVWTLFVGLDFDAQNLPWVFYGENSPYDSSKRTIVKRYDGLNWIQAGNRNFAGGVSFQYLKFSPDNTPYVAFRDKNHSYSASVMRFNGSSWQYVGPPGFTPQSPAGGALYTRIAFDKTGKLFLVYCDFTNNSRVSVMSYNGTSWSFVGSPNISGSNAAYTSIMFDSQNRPLISYVGGSNSNIFIKRFNGSSWVDLSPAGGIATGSFPDMAIDKNDNLFVVYTANDKPSVQKFSGGNWSLIGSALSPTIAMYTSIAVDTNGIPYISYQDFTDRYKNGMGPYHCATVLKYNSGIVTGVKNKLTESQNAFSVYPNPTSTSVQVKFEAITQAKGVFRIMDIKGQVLYSEKISGAFEKEYDLRTYSKGVYFIELVTAEATECKTIVVE